MSEKRLARYLEIQAGVDAGRLKDELSPSFRFSGLEPLLKWPGGKSSELRTITEKLPTRYARIVEPFVGGGAFFWASRPTQAVINDISPELISFYRHIGSRNAEFERAVRSLSHDWDLLSPLSDRHLGDVAAAYLLRRQGATPNEGLERTIRDALRGLLSDFASSHRTWFLRLDVLTHEVNVAVENKVARMAELERTKGLMPDGDVFSNIDGALKAGMYMAIRQQYNEEVVGKSEVGPIGAAVFFFIREFSYAAMFRYSKKGKFNVPFGGISYARKSLQTKLDRIFSPAVQDSLASAIIHCNNFEDFLNQVGPCRDDFIFVDPPYDSDFSTYGNRAFDADDQKRLAQQLNQMSSGPRIMLVVKATPLMEHLYPRDRWNVHGYDKTYMWTIKERNDRDAVHLMITNY